nr:MAG TPA: hypothetical protein [Caudoviricetes sp.]
MFFTAYCAFLQPYLPKKHYILTNIVFKNIITTI